MSKMFLSFIELDLRGANWREELPPYDAPDLRYQNLAGARVFRAGADCEILLVESEIVIRRFLLKSGTPVIIANQVISFEKDKIDSELTVDEDLRAGKRLRIT